MTQRPLNLTPPAWLNSPALAAINQCCGGELRVVGGAVRNHLLGEKVSDIDVASPMIPQELQLQLQRQGIQSIPTGIDHGTVTIVLPQALMIDGQKISQIEHTTLRSDIATDGRHATVKFTTDWREDAARRDFTFNAMSFDLSGQFYDYFDGVTDLAAARVRFIGTPKLRIQEDYLRILRYFRFQTRYGSDEIDKASLNACIDLADGLAFISIERIRDELLKILKADNPIPGIRSMLTHRIFRSREKLNNLLSDPQGLERLEQVLSNQRRLKASATSYQSSNSEINMTAVTFMNSSSLNLRARLSAITKPYFSDSSEKSWVESQINQDFIASLHRMYNIPESIAPFAPLKLPQYEWRPLIQQWMIDRFFGKTIIEWIESGCHETPTIRSILYAITKVSNIPELLSLLLGKIEINDPLDLAIKITTSTPSRMPVNGDILVSDYGYVQGESIGKELSRLEDIYIKSDFKFNKDDLLRLIKPPPEF